MRADRHDRRAPAVQPPQSTEDADAVHVRQTEVEQHQVGHRLVDDLQGRPAVAGGLHLVVAGPQVDRQGPHDRRVVVDHQHPVTSARAIVAAVGSLRPAGSSAVSVAGTKRRGRRRGLLGREGAAHRLHQAAGHRQPEPDAVCRRHVAEPLERREEPFDVAVGDAGARVDDRAAPTRSPRLRRVDPDVRVRGGVYLRAFSTDVGDHPLQQPGIGPQRRQVVGSTSTTIGSAPGQRAERPLGTDVGQVDLAQGEVMRPVCSRLMSSRLADQRGQPVGGLLDGGQQLLLVLVATRSIVGVAQAGRRPP